MSETSASLETRQVDVTVGTIKRLMLMGYDHYNVAVREGATAVATYWDGYLRALKHILEQEHE